MEISAYSMQGRRTHMEDYFDIGYQMKPPDKRSNGEWPYEYFYYGIFDGHGGCEASKFAKENLLKCIVRQADFWSSSDEDVMRSIRKGFADCHMAMREQLSKWTRTNRTLPSTAGTTASVLFIRNGKFYSGHVGDSRIVISRKHPETKQWISHQVTNDHKPESELEMERIERAGGEVRPKLGVHRVVWRRPVFNPEFDYILKAHPRRQDYDECLKKIETYPVEESIVLQYQIIPFLAIARSLGDFWSINPISGQYIVSPEPDVMCRPIDKDDQCILLATDGLWNVMNSSLAVRFLQELKILKDGERDKKEYSEDYFITDNFYDVKLNGDKNHALSLVYMAYQLWERRRLKSDNITAVVAMLSDNIIPSTAHQQQRCALSEQQQSNDHHHNQHQHYSTKEELLLLLTDKYIDSNTIQLAQTPIFYEHIKASCEPRFIVHPHTREDIDFFHELDLSIIESPNTSLFQRDYLIEPRNYMRVMKADCHSIDFYMDGSNLDMSVGVKRVSDDPADEIEEPVRLNRKNVKVRDSSCQASQPMYDFNESWLPLFRYDSDDIFDDENEEEEDDVDEEDDDVDEHYNPERGDNVDKLLDRTGKIVGGNRRKRRPGFELVFEHEIEFGDVVKEGRRSVVVDEAYIERHGLSKNQPRKKRVRYEEEEDHLTRPRAKSTRCI